MTLVLFVFAQRSILCSGETLETLICTGNNRVANWVGEAVRQGIADGINCAWHVCGKLIENNLYVGYWHTGGASGLKKMARHNVMEAVMAIIANCHGQLHLIAP